MSSPHKLLRDYFSFSICLIETSLLKLRSNYLDFLFLGILPQKFIERDFTLEINHLMDLKTKHANIKKHELRSY